MSWFFFTFYVIIFTYYLLYKMEGMYTNQNEANKHHVSFAWVDLNFQLVFWHRDILSLFRNIDEINISVQNFEEDFEMHGIVP